MEVVQVNNKKLIKAFVNFPMQLYKGDDNYVPYMLADLTKTLRHLLLEKKTYTALLVVENKKPLARILFTIERNKQLSTEKCGFFSMFECVNDQEVCNLLLDETVKLMKTQGAEYISGTYFPYDQDNRRGILCQGYDRAPLIFTSYNPPYYNDLLVAYGLQKQTDALEYVIDVESADSERLHKIAQYAQTKYNFRVDTINWSNIDRDIADVHTIMKEATNEVIYQDAMTIESLNEIVKQWKHYLNKDYILIARSNVDDSPIGVAMALPDYFQVFKKMRGKMDLKGLLTLVKERKRIKSIRAIMQYVIPAYQSTGAVVALYSQMYDSVKKNGITYVEAGTIMEHNERSNMAIQAIGGQLVHVYRIYFAKIEQ